MERESVRGATWDEDFNAEHEVSGYGNRSPQMAYHAEWLHQRLKGRVPQEKEFSTSSDN